MRAGRGMFERFTDKARRVVVRAQEEARGLNHDYIGTEHILLGVVHEADGLAARTLESLGVSLAAVRQDTTAAVIKGQQPMSGHIPFTPQAKHVLELSLREALQLACDYIGTEHILLGLLRESEGVAAQVLTGLGLDLTAVRARVVRLQEEVAGSRGRPVISTSRLPRSRLVEERPTALSALDRRVSAIERWAALTPDIGDLNEQITQLSRDKEAAVDRRDFEAAAALRDEERELQAQRTARVREWTGGPGLAEVIGQLREEIARLRAALRQHGIDPGDAA